jgi:predicted nucleic acid-binding protein
MTAILIDTNVLVYAHDRSEFVKQGRAIEVLGQLQAIGSGRLSAQCLAEFFSVVVRGPVPRLTVAEASLQVERLARAWPVLDVTSQIVLEATRGVRDYQLSFWDAQIWAAARLNQIPVVFSEDFSAGSTLEGIRFVNPFAEDFRTEAWFVDQR